MSAIRRHKAQGTRHGNKPLKFWRLIDSGPLDGASNMALDEAILSSFDPGSSTPVFRLYGWNPAAFSIGRFQDAGQSLDFRKCRDSGVAAVRRMTAGGIIYHGDEITYSVVCAPEHIPEVRSIKESFRKLCGFLLLAYRELGLDAGFAADRNACGKKLGERTAFCFAGREEYDIVVNGRKIGGNAQRRKRDVIFQHGSIPLRNCLAEASGFLRGSESTALTEAATVSLEELDIVRNIEVLKGILVKSFENNFSISLSSVEPDAQVADTAAHLRESKYSSDSWNMYGIKV